MQTTETALALPLAKLELMTPKQLLEVHNLLAPLANLPVVARFADKPTALKRTSKVQDVAKFAQTQLKPVTLEQAAKGAKKVAAKKASAAKPVAVTSVGPAIAVAKPSSMEAMLRQLICEGKTNEEIVSILDLPKEKRGYPAWTRQNMRKKGTMPEAVAHVSRRGA